LATFLLMKVFPNFWVCTAFFDETEIASNFLGEKKWLCFIIELSWTMATLDKRGLAFVKDKRAAANTKSLSSPIFILDNIFILLKTIIQIYRKRQL
jgi:hypothetical protein